MLTVGQEVMCPYCGEEISLTLDLSEPEQEYIEDCSVCCRPMMVHYVAHGLEIQEVSVRAEFE